MYCNKHITLTLFVCLICTLCFFFIKWLFNIFLKKIKKNEYISKTYNDNNSYNNKEYFNNKRSAKIKIYRSDEIFDPDEQPEFEEYDPDDNPIKFDPNQQPYLDDEEINSDELTIPYKIQIPYTHKKKNSKKKFRNFP